MIQPEAALPPSPVFTREWLALANLSWIKFVSFHYDGRYYDYGFEAGRAEYTDRQAEDVARRERCLQRAQEDFLREVKLEVRH